MTTDTGIKIGYARVSTAEQQLDLQIDALREYGVSDEYIFSEHVSGVKAKRPAFQDCMRFLRRGDTLVVWKIDRLSRSRKELFDTVEILQERGVHLACVTQPIDTSDPIGQMIFGFFAIFAEFERAMIRERTMAGLKVANAKGRKGGAPKKIKPRTLKRAIELKKQGIPHWQVCEELNVKKSTLSREIKLHNDAQELKAAEQAAKELREERKAA